MPEAKKRSIEYWTQDTLSDEALLQFFETLGEDDFAIHVQSKTRYSFDVYAAAIRRLWSASSPARRAS